MLTSTGDPGNPTATQPANTAMPFMLPFTRNHQTAPVLFTAVHVPFTGETGHSSPEPTNLANLPAYLAMPFTRPPWTLYPHPRRPVHGGKRITTYHDLTGFRRDCLQAIAAVDDEPYGLALKAWLDDRYSEPVNHSRLYQNLDRLVADDLVQPTETTTDDERRTVYTLTDTGHRLLEVHAGDIDAATIHWKPTVREGCPQ